MDEEASPEQIHRAGQMIEDLVRSMAEEDLPPLAVASALLGGALSVLSAHMQDEAILRILENAMDGVRSGALRDAGETRQ
jgi:Na+/H+-dicarboxylate symporter